MKNAAYKEKQHNQYYVATIKIVMPNSLKIGGDFMYCKNCGKPLSDNAQFCSGCGAQVGVINQASNEPTGTPVQKAGNPTLGAALKTIKGFFSKDTVKTVGESAKSQGAEWVIIELISAVVYSFALALNVKQIMDALLGAVSSVIGDSIYKFGPLFLYGLLISVGTYFLLSICTFGAMKLVLKKNVSIKSVLNLVATASLPLTVAYLLNMIFGFLWTPFVLIFFLSALIATAVLLYVGIQKLDKLEKSPYIAYICIWTVVIAVIVIVISIITKSVIDSAISDLTSSLSNSLFGGKTSDLFSLFS